MSDRLDSIINQLRIEEPDQRLDQLEPLVWRRIDAQNRAAPAGGLLPVRAVMTAGALALGVVMGGAAATTAAAHDEEISVFSTQPELAPSTLLDGRA